MVGDYNGDGQVDAADYTVWRDTRGSTTNLTADGDQSGSVGQADFNLWKHQFGAQASASAARSVPEPGALAFLIPGVLRAFVSQWSVVRGPWSVVFETTDS
jgi:hypothetical protein